MRYKNIKNILNRPLFYAFTLTLTGCTKTSNNHLRPEKEMLIAYNNIHAKDKVSNLSTGPYSVEIKREAHDEVDSDGKKVRHIELSIFVSK